MNYDEAITNIIAEIKIDKSIIQPWRNKATARLEEVQAFLRMGKSISRLEAPAELAQECTCPVGGRRADCPQHGRGV